MITIWVNILLIKIHSNKLVTPAQYNIIFASICYSKPWDTVKGVTYYRSSLNKLQQALSTYYLILFCSLVGEGGYN